MDYPIAYIFPIQLKDGTLVQLRPVHPTDGKAAFVFREKFSKQSLLDRFMGYVPSLSEKLINRLTKIDYHREMAIVAEVIMDDHKEAIAVGRIVAEYENNTIAEIALIVADDWQGKGLGSKMIDYMIKVAKDMGFQTLHALLYEHNTKMSQILERKNFSFKSADFGTIDATLKLI